MPAEPGTGQELTHCRTCGIVIGVVYASEHGGQCGYCRRHDAEAWERAEHPPAPAPAPRPAPKIVCREINCALPPLTLMGYCDRHQLEVNRVLHRGKGSGRPRS